MRQLQDGNDLSHSVDDPEDIGGLRLFGETAVKTTDNLSDCDGAFLHVAAKQKHKASREQVSGPRGNAEGWGLGARSVQDSQAPVLVKPAA